MPLTIQSSLDGDTTSWAGGIGSAAPIPKLLVRFKGVPCPAVSPQGQGEAGTRVWAVRGLPACPLRRPAWARMESGRLCWTAHRPAGRGSRSFSSAASAGGHPVRRGLAILLVPDSLHGVVWYHACRSRITARQTAWGHGLIDCRRQFAVVSYHGRTGSGRLVRVSATHLRLLFHQAACRLWCRTTPAPSCGRNVVWYDSCAGHAAGGAPPQSASLKAKVWSGTTPPPPRHTGLPSWRCSQAVAFLGSVTANRRPAIPVAAQSKAPGTTSPRDVWIYPHARIP